MHLFGGLAVNWGKTPLPPIASTVARSPFAYLLTYRDRPHPRNLLAGDLYSSRFYGQLFRVLAPRRRLFHDIGDLDSRSGRNVARGVVRHLQEGGFARTVRQPQALGLVALK